MRRSQLESEPAVWEEVIDLRSLCRRESSENILHVFKWIDAKAFTSFDNGHDSSGSSTALLRAGEEPVAPTENERFDAAFATIVADFNKRMLKVDKKSLPAVEGVGNCFAEFRFWRLKASAFIKPVFEQKGFGLGESLTKVKTLCRREGSCETLNIEKAFDYAHGKFSSDGVEFPSIFEIAMNVSPAVGRGGTIFDNLVVFISAISLKNSSEATKNRFRVARVLGIRVIVENVGVVGVTAIDPDETAVSFSKTFFNNWKSGGIGLNYAAFENNLANTISDGSKKGCNFFKPSRHRRARDGNSQSSKNLFLAIERQVEPEFVGCDFSEKPRTGDAFINWLVRFLSGEYLTGAFFTRVFKENVLNSFEKRLNKLYLVRNIEANNFSRLTTARAE